jgi:tetratricopeptide (TPR) repeat protein
VGVALRNLGVIQMYAGRAPDAQATLTDALGELERAFSPDSGEIQGARLWLISVLQHLGDVDGAAALARDALTALRRMQGRETVDTAAFLLVLADVLRMHADLDDAVAALDEARAIVEAEPAPDAAMLGQIFMIRASTETKLDLDVAKADALAAVAAYERSSPAGDGRLVPSRVVLGAIERAHGDVEASARDLEAALALAEQTLPADDQHRLEAMLELADTRIAQGRRAEAVRLVTPVVEALAGGGNAPMLDHARKTLAQARAAP